MKAKTSKVLHSDIYNEVKRLGIKGCSTKKKAELLQTLQEFREGIIRRFQLTYFDPCGRDERNETAVVSTPMEAKRMIRCFFDEVDQPDDHDYRNLATFMSTTTSFQKVSVERFYVKSDDKNKKLYVAVGRDQIKLYASKYGVEVDLKRPEMTIKRLC